MVILTEQHMHIYIYCIILYYIILLYYIIILYYIVLYYIILYYIIYNLSVSDNIHAAKECGSEDRKIRYAEVEHRHV